MKNQENRAVYEFQVGVALIQLHPSHKPICQFPKINPEWNLEQIKYGPSDSPGYYEFNFVLRVWEYEGIHDPFKQKVNYKAGSAHLTK